MTGPLSGDLGELLSELTQRRLRDEGAVDPAGRASGAPRIPGQGDQVVDGDAEPRQNDDALRAGFEDGPDRGALPHRLALDPSPERPADSGDAERLAGARLATQGSEPGIAVEARVPHHREIAQAKLKEPGHSGSLSWGGSSAGLSGRPKWTLSRSCRRNDGESAQRMTVRSGPGPIRNPASGHEAALVLPVGGHVNATVRQGHLHDGDLGQHDGPGDDRVRGERDDGDGTHPRVDGRAPRAQRVAGGAGGGGHDHPVGVELAEELPVRLDPQPHQDDLGGLQGDVVERQQDAALAGAVTASALARHHLRREHAPPLPEVRPSANASMAPGS